MPDPGGRLLSNPPCLWCAQCKGYFTPKEDMPEPEEIDLNTQQFDQLRNQIAINKSVAKALDENPAAVSNAVTHLMLGGIIQGLQVIEVKINQLHNKIDQQHNEPRILVP